MKISAFNGSPKADRGNTHVMVSALLEGAAQAGASTENVLLARKKIGHCIGCFTCWAKTPGKCVLNDDMGGLLKLYMASDIVIMASPLYVDHVTGIMKDFMDRSLPLVCPQFEMGDADQTRHVARYGKYPAIVWVSNCGFSEKDQFAVLRLACDRDIRNNQAEIIAQIYRGQGPLLTSDDPELQPVLNDYKDFLRRAGKDIVMNSKIPDDLGTVAKRVKKIFLLRSLLFFLFPVLKRFLFCSFSDILISSRHSDPLRGFLGPVK